MDTVIGSPPLARRRSRRATNQEKAHCSKDRQDSDSEEKKRKKEARRLRDRVNDWKAKTTRIATLEKYKSLTAKILKLEKDTIYRRRETADPTVKDDKILQQVINGMATENPDVWDARTEALGTAFNCKVDYVIATEERELGHEDFTDLKSGDTQVLIKWEDYPVPSWERAKDIDGDEPAEYQKRLLYLDFIELFFREMIGDAAFEVAYPFRYLTYEKGRGDGGFIGNKRALYRNKLRAIEHHFNTINKMFGLPPVFIEDWTKWDDLDETLRNIMYIQSCLLTDEVSELLKRQQQLEHIKCGQKCGSSGRNSCAGLITSATDCCGRNDQMNLCDDDIPRFLKKGDRMQNQCLFRVECTDNCGCDPNLCRNRVVQRGRQHPLVIFRDNKKEWTIRCLTEIPRHGFVAEYCGVVQFGKSVGRAQQYDYNLGYDVTMTNGRQGPLYVCAYEKGNETRFLSHSCTPNCYCEATVVERNGIFYNRGVLRASRTTVRGEELTFDYFGGRALDDGDWMDVRDMFPKGCLCGSPACRFTFPLLRESERKYRVVLMEERKAEKLEKSLRATSSNCEGSINPEKELTPSSTNDFDSLDQDVRETSEKSMTMEPTNYVVMDDIYDDDDTTTSCVSLSSSRDDTGENELPDEQNQGSLNLTHEQCHSKRSKSVNAAEACRHSVRVVKRPKKYADE